jgi:UDP-glucose 4-epimerase
MSRYVVTGGAGFIGSHLTRTLLAEGHEVTVVDTLILGKREVVPEGVRLLEVDIRNTKELETVFQNADGVFHLAAIPRVQPSILDPVGTNEVNVGGTVSVLKAAHDAKVKRVVYAASSSAYGPPETLPLTEDMKAHPISPYGLQKYESELYCTLFSEIYGLETVSLRYFNVYGPGGPATGAYALVIPIFIKQRQDGVPLTIVKDGEQSRDFTHVRDVARANILAMQSPNVGKGEVINIGGGHPRTVNEIARMIGGPVTWLPERIEPKHTAADITKAKELLDWAPEVNFEEGIIELKKLAGIS